MAAGSRQIFISLSSLLRTYDREGDALLAKIPEDALFFFGSKRSWVFPQGEAEKLESTGENPRYTRPQYQPVRDLILAKESKDQVFWLKPPGFVYNGDLFHGDPEAFPRASQWLQRHKDPSTGEPYRPLLLEPEWWNSQFNPRQGKFYTHVNRIIKNMQCGAHDYGPVMELLHQSNPTLEIMD
eukprot:TRINITY_DN10587_c0_g1_i1.p1 TRINITY_DN10587_c0_g1~~TRINITY_DN10587_c0_g1_i1.p1  ORF type:complete len:183 (+),score=20.73 TRINITY_DN10587_c0_g1_i1:233-781(+)